MRRERIIQDEEKETLKQQPGECRREGGGKRVLLPQQRQGKERRNLSSRRGKRKGCGREKSFFFDQLRPSKMGGAKNTTRRGVCLLGKGMAKLIKKESSAGGGPERERGKQGKRHLPKRQSGFPG